jgi:hypothetical protein
MRSMRGARPDPTRGPSSRLGPAPLAAASLATSLANVTGYSVIAGLAGATSTLCGQARV